MARSRTLARTLIAWLGSASFILTACAALGGCEIIIIDSVSTGAGGGPGAVAGVGGGPCCESAVTVTGAGGSFSTNAGGAPWDTSSGTWGTETGGTTSTGSSMIAGAGGGNGDTTSAGAGGGGGVGGDGGAGG